MSRRGCLLGRGSRNGCTILLLGIAMRLLSPLSCFPVAVFANPLILCLDLAHVQTNAPSVILETLIRNVIKRNENPLTHWIAQVGLSHRIMSPHESGRRHKHHSRCLSCPAFAPVSGLPVASSSSSRRPGAGPCPDGFPGPDPWPCHRATSPPELPPGPLFQFSNAAWVRGLPVPDACPLALDAAADTSATLRGSLREGPDPPPRWRW